MDRTHTKRISYGKILGIVLAIILAFNVLIFAATLLPNPSKATGFTPMSTAVQVVNRVSDPDTSNDMNFIDVPRVHDGRIWTDKSVDVGNGTDDFKVIFSALSQSFKVTEGFAIPADTVFVIDVSGSMGYSDMPGGPTRISILTEALNEAIAILQDANPQNRIAVVAYGGRSGGYGRVENVLSLGRYTAANGDFFTTSGTTVSVRAVPVAGSGGNTIVSSLKVEGSTPTQWGIYYGAQMLENASRTAQVDVTDDTGAVVDEVTVTRRPNIILMTDGEPTMAWTNYTFAASPANPLTPGSSGVQLVDSNTPGIFLGDGSYGELGVSLLTVLTAADRQQRVLDHYFPTNWNAGQPSGQPGPDVGFFTIGLGVQPDQASTNLIRATMDPGNYAGAVDSNVRSGMLLPSPFTNNPFVSYYNPAMDVLLNSFATPGAAIDFNAQTRNSFGNYNWGQSSTLPELGWDEVLIEVINSNNLDAAALDFADLFFEASNLDELRAAFRSIATDIQVQSNETVTNVDTSPDFDGWLVFSDVLGDYMQFRGSLALNFDGTPYPRNSFDLNNSSVRAAYEPILREHMNYGLPSGSPDLLSPQEISKLIDDNIALGNTTHISYFADQHRNFLSATNPAGAFAKVEIYSMMGKLPNPVMPGGQTDLMYLTFHVVTALETATFTEIFTPPVGTGGAQAPTSRNLKAGDQLVRWYIPASLIPLRTVDSETAEVSGNTRPARLSFNVGLDLARVPDQVSDEYRTENTAANGLLYFYANSWRDNQDVTLVFDVPHENNPFYNKGRPGFGDGHGAILKTSNPTATAAHSSFDRSFTYDNRLVSLNWMGNNGRLTLAESGDLMLTKGFGFDGISGMQVPEDISFAEPIRFTIIVPGGSNITLNFPDDFSWVPARARYELKTSVNLPAGTYTVTKTGGQIVGGDWIYLPQPGVNSVTIVANEVASLDFINEYFPRLPAEQLPALRVRKIFHGLDNLPLPEDFRLLIEGPVGDEEGPVRPNNNPAWMINPATNRYELRVNLQEALTSTALRNLAEGEYLISEANFEFEGADFIRAAWLVREATDRYPMFGDETTDPTSPLITVDIEGIDDTVARIDNFYEEVDIPEEEEPPTSEPPTSTVPNPPISSRETTGTSAPQTGDNRQVALFIALLILGIGCVCAASFYWYKKDWIHAKLFPAQKL